MKLKLEQIIIDKGTQTRDEIDQKTVTEYAEALMNKDVFPPVKVFYDGINYYLADGFHRYLANKQIKSTHIEADVTNGTLRNALEFAIGTNDKHGLKRSIKDKRKAVLIAVDDVEWGSLTNREIAKLCRVSHTFVNSIKEELEKPKQTKPKEPLKARNKDQNKPTNIDTEFTQDDKITELLVTQKQLEEENTKLLDQLALKVMDVPPEQKKMAEQTIEELREENKRLTFELESMTVSRDGYMKENAEMKKQLNWYKKKLQKLETV
jgi:FtsZ-binding cell division protein ZapB